MALAMLQHYTDYKGGHPSVATLPNKLKHPYPKQNKHGYVHNTIGSGSLGK